MTVVAAAMIREEEAETSRRIVAEAQANVSYVRRRQGRPRRCFQIVRKRKLAVKAGQVRSEIGVFRKSQRAGSNRRAAVAMASTISAIERMISAAIGQTL